jgi:hypothetical protein
MHLYHGVIETRKSRVVLEDWRLEMGLHLLFWISCFDFRQSLSSDVCMVVELSQCPSLLPLLRSFEFGLAQWEQQVLLKEQP